MLQVRPGFSIGGFIPHTLPPQEASEITQAPLLSLEDEKWMFIALLEAMRSCGITNPNPPVGCVIVKDGREIARGRTEPYRLRHAERVAFESVKDANQLQGATVYVTLEPCSHQGHQAPCADLFQGRGLARVVIGAFDPNPKVSGQGVACLKTFGISVAAGVLESENILWILPFLAHQLQRRPVWIAKWAQTKSGTLADDAGSSKWITGPKARAYGHWLRQKYDAVLVGAGTVLGDLPQLTVRDCRKPILRNPMRLIFDPHARITEVNESLNASIFSPEATSVLFCKEGALPKGLSRRTHVFPLKSNDPVDELRTWTESKECEDLLGHPLQSVYVEGGTKLLNSLLQTGGMDLIHRFTSTTSKIAGTKHQIQFNPEGYSALNRIPFDEDVLEEFLSTALLKLIPKF